MDRRVREATVEDLAVVASWIASERETELWAGPGIPFPLQLSDLPEQVDMAHAINVALAGPRGLDGFGQVLPRSPGHVHLARVIVRPDLRGRGVGKELVEALLSAAGASGASLVTLNVYAGNAAAVALYRSAGFQRVEQGKQARGRPGLWSMELRLHAGLTEVP